MKVKSMRIPEDIDKAIAYVSRSEKVVRNTSPILDLAIIDDLPPSGQGIRS